MRGRHQPCVQLKKVKSEGEMLGYSSCSGWEMGDHSMKEKCPLAVSMVLKEKNSETASQQERREEKNCFKKPGSFTWD